MTLKIFRFSMARTLGQILSSRTVTDDEIRAAIKAATKAERDKQLRDWLKLCKDRYVDLIVQAQRNVRLLQEKVK